MNIVVLDHVYLEQNHISRLQKLGNLTVFHEPPRDEEELRRRLQTADIAIVGWSHITRDLIAQADRLKMISIWATTCHYADLPSATKRGIVVTHVPGYATESVAEHTFALMLASVRKLPLADRHVREGKFDWSPFGGAELAGKTLGIIGTGSIGCRVAEIAVAFGMRVMGYDKYPNPRRCAEIGIEQVTLERLLRESDIVSLHVTLTTETEKLLGQREIESMKQGSVIVNTSQGKVIDEKALTEALKSRRIAYAGLDVFEEEPPSKDNPLFSLDNTVLSPHIGFNTTEAAKRCTDLCINNVVSFLEGHIQNAC